MIQCQEEFPRTVFGGKEVEYDLKKFFSNNKINVTEKLLITTLTLFYFFLNLIQYNISINYKVQYSLRIAFSKDLPFVIEVNPG